jgi:myo-inositol-1(or 4)-monophosphatase
MEQIVETDLINIGVAALRRGADVLQSSWGRVTGISHKGKLDLVTDADRRAEEAVVTFLQQQAPLCGILAEEQNEIVGRSGNRWILDPLDGTTNFAHGYPFFCVSLALEQSGRIVWGGVLDPLRDELFSARCDEGAFCNGVPVHVSETRELDQAMLCTGFPYDVHDSSEDNLSHFTRLIKKARAIRRDGAAALDLCYVAMGRFDGFWEMKLKPWDMAAGALIVSEAGGRVSAFDGSDRWLATGAVLASNGRLHDSLLEVLAADRR